MCLLSFGHVKTDRKFRWIEKTKRKNNLKRPHALNCIYKSGKHKPIAPLFNSTFSVNYVYVCNTYKKRARQECICVCLCLCMCDNATEIWINDNASLICFHLRGDKRSERIESCWWEKKNKNKNTAENQIWAVLVYFFHNIQWDNVKLRNFK